MKKVIACAFLAFIFSQASAAENESLNMLEQLHDGVCKEHKNPELCKRVVGLIMKGVKQNDDLFAECLKNKPLSREDQSNCQSSQEIREKIESYK